MTDDGSRTPTPRGVRSAATWMTDNLAMSWARVKLAIAVADRAENEARPSALREVERQLARLGDNAHAVRVSIRSMREAEEEEKKT